MSVFVIFALLPSLVIVKELLISMCFHLIKTSFIKTKKKNKVKSKTNEIYIESKQNTH